jgi:hypothetical protein
MICKDGIHIFTSEVWDSRCNCLLWSRREHRNLQARQQIKSGSRQIWKKSKLEWALNKLAKPVIQKDLEGNPLAVFRSCMEAEYVTGANHRNISQATLGNRHTVNGYRWELA